MTGCAIAAAAGIAVNTSQTSARAGTTTNRRTTNIKETLYCILYKHCKAFVFSYLLFLLNFQACTEICFFNSQVFYAFSQLNSCKHLTDGILTYFTHSEGNHFFVISIFAICLTVTIAHARICSAADCSFVCIFF